MISLTCHLSVSVWLRRGALLWNLVVVVGKARGLGRPFEKNPFFSLLDPLVLPTACIKPTSLDVNSAQYTGVRTNRRLISTQRALASPSSASDWPQCSSFPIYDRIS